MHPPKSDLCRHVHVFETRCSFIRIRMYLVTIARVWSHSFGPHPRACSGCCKLGKLRLRLREKPVPAVGVQNTSRYFLEYTVDIAPIRVLVYTVCNHTPSSVRSHRGRGVGSIGDTNGASGLCVVCIVCAIRIMTLFIPRTSPTPRPHLAHTSSPTPPSLNSDCNCIRLFFSCIL